jgi:hypothetical protein
LIITSHKFLYAFDTGEMKRKYVQGGQVIAVKARKHGKQAIVVT